MRIISLLLFAFFFGCLRSVSQEKCEWVLTAEKEGIDMMSVKDLENDWIPVCARNYVVNKQRCNLKIKLNMAKAVQDKAFRLVDMKVDSSGLLSERD